MNAGLFIAVMGAHAGAMDCPAGMVLVGGEGTIGLESSPYGIVPTAHLERVDAPERGCAAAVASTPGASACWVQTDTVDPMVSARHVAVDSFCIESHPFPGRGQAYSSDGLSVWDAHKLDGMLKTGRFGKRRLCTFTEFQAAVAGLQENRPFIFGRNPTEGVCEPSTIGSDPRCRNATTGVAEYAAVHSHWVVADAGFVAGACNAPPCRGAGARTLKAGALVVAGGTNRVQTRQAPFTPHTWHDHGEPTVDACGFHGWDDQPVICADPGRDEPAAALAWSKFRQFAIETGSMRRAISDALGAPICP
ncbi:MAG: hypothetical protein VX127_15340 [Myxococcota bacterium]|nr:hypothetical protein [Myxococcota bacterium]